MRADATVSAEPFIEISCMLAVIDEKHATFVRKGTVTLGKHFATIYYTGATEHARASRSPQNRVAHGAQHGLPPGLPAEASSSATSMQEARQQLPIHTQRDAIVEALKSSQV